MDLLTSDRRHIPVWGADPTRLSPAHKQVLAATVGLAAVIWFLMLSGWLGITPGTVMTTRYNVLFSSDTSTWITAMVGEAKSPVNYAHPLQGLLWRGPCRTLYHLLRFVLSSGYAAVFAARLLVAIIAGIGVGFLAFLALQIEIEIPQFVLLFIMYLLFTCSTTICLPEHFAISNGLLSVAFVVPCLIASAQTRAILLAILAFFIGGTTITNVLFPFGSFVHYSLRSMRAKIALVVAAIPVALGGTLFVYRRSASIHSFINQYWNLRLFHDPIKAGIFAVFALVGPVIGPRPSVARVPGWDMVSYEPLDAPLQLTNFSWFQVIGVVAWVALLVVCVSRGLKNERTRPHAVLLLGWILFNAVFHNLWGGEFVLYSPHWSWALMGLVILGARDLSRAFVATVFVPIVVSQLYSFLAIRSALQTIVR